MISEENNMSEQAKPIVSEPISIAEKIISGSVVLGGLAITLLLIGILHLNLQDLNTDITSTAADCIRPKSVEAMSTTLSHYQACQIALEAEAQTLRTARAQSIVSSRLFIHAIAILAGISLMTMGSSFVFARIKGPASNLEAEMKLASSGDWKFLFNSYFPGVILTLFGTFIVVSTVYFAKGQTSTTNDRPVCLDSPKNSFPVGFPDYFATGNLSKEQKKKKAVGLNKLIELGVINEGDIENE